MVKQNASGGRVANMSLGGGISSTIDIAVANAISKGIVMVVAAGNSAADACNSSPARVPEAITVGATTRADAGATFSNFGTCVDIYAPGVDITSAWHSSTTATRTISGTSMASPHVAGVAARMLSTTPSLDPATLATALSTTSTKNIISGLVATSPNNLLYINPAN